MQRINLDSIGPLPEDDNGNKYIHVIIDTFTRTIEITPTKSVEAEDAANALLDWCSRYQIPEEMINDNGTQYINALFDELARLLHIERLSTIAYSKEENAIVERANKEIMRHLRA